LPQVDFPTLMIQASMSGASPDVMAATVAAPLERHLGFISDVTEMTSRSSLGSTQITLQFGLNRDIDGAARDVEAAINAARADLPSNLRSNPTYRKYNPSDSPILLMVLTSSTRTSGQLYDSAATVLQQKLSQIEGVGDRGCARHFGRIRVLARREGHADPWCHGADLDYRDVCGHVSVRLLLEQFFSDGVDDCHRFCRR